MYQNCANGVVRIPVPLPGSPLKYTNSYLIKGERNLLIDTGFHRPECKVALWAALEELGASPDRTDVFITHHHSDHIGLAPALAGTEGTIYIGETELHWLRSYETEGWGLFDKRFAAEGFPMDEIVRLRGENPARVFAPPPCDRYVPVKDGQVLSYGGWQLVCRRMPGHTPGHMCLHLPEQKLMFLGDHVLFDITPNIVAWPGVENALADYLGSLRLLREYDIDVPLPGHREVSCPLSDRIQALLGHHADRLKETEQILQRRPGLSAYELAGHLTWNIRSRSWETFPLAQKWFAVGETMAHLDYLLAEGSVSAEEDEKGVRRYALTGEGEEHGHG
ncbi:MAG: MBL fold metallo-hydrolase [Oscillospiraceae bacterium]|jgi:glyoxylase-like metal-dependent hydrolase (beta-lactamase superfamily II)